MGNRLISLAVVALVLAGCTTVPGATPTLAPTPTPTASLAAPTASPSPSPSPAQPTPTATEPTAADPCVGSTADDPAVPPDAAIEDPQSGTLVTGKLGSYTYCNVAADALPPRAENGTAIALGDPPVINLIVTGTGIVGYRAGYWPASEWQGDEVRYAEDELAEPTSVVETDGPPAGDWMLALHLTYPEGDATYYWHVTVP